MTMIKLTEFKIKDNWNCEKNTIVDEASETYVSVGRILTVKTAKYYRGIDAGGGPEEIDKTLISFGGEDIIFVNETVSEVIDLIKNGCGD